jgi:hypothetical protein
MLVLIVRAGYSEFEHASENAPLSALQHDCSTPSASIPSHSSFGMLAECMFTSIPLIKSNWIFSDLMEKDL